MSWDVLLFSLKTKVTSVEEVNEDNFIPIDFKEILEQNFKTVDKGEGHYEFQGNEFSIDYFIDKEPKGVTMLSLYGEKAIYALIEVAKKSNWQIFDTFLNAMVDLDDPSKNGYKNFKSYIQQILKNPKS